MPVPTLTGVPDQIEAGNTVTFTETFSQYPSSLWTLEFVLNLKGVATTINAAVSGTGFLVTVPANLAPGIYDFAEYVTETATSQRATAKTGTLEILPDLAVNAAQSIAVQTLAKLEAAILTLSTSTNRTVSFNGQSFTNQDMKSLTDQRTYWKAEVLREQSAAQNQRRCVPSIGRIAPRFSAEVPWFPLTGRNW